jgi:hypothetical protein
MTFKFDEDYRATDEYKAWVAGIKADYPTMPLYLIEQAIIAHKTDPQAYKKDKKSKEVFMKAPKQRMNDKQEVINGAITIEDAPEVVEEPATSAVVVEEVDA